MAGIVRIVITDQINGRGAYRFEQSRLMWPGANKLYRSIFQKLGLELEAGDEEMRCTRAEFKAGYDYELGIDVVLKFRNGSPATLQEKFLRTGRNTLTVEYMQDWRTGEQGDWFKMRCQYYFVGYYRPEFPTSGFSTYEMVIWSTLANDPCVVWAENRNKNDGARSSFRYVAFKCVPMRHVIAAKFN